MLFAIVSLAGLAGAIITAILVFILYSKDKSYVLPYIGFFVCILIFAGGAFLSVKGETGENKPAGTPFERFEAMLNNAGYNYEKVTMGAELVGAKTGMKYKFDFGQVELYQFEDTADTLSKAKKDGGLTLEGIGVFPCKFNGNLALLCDLSKNEETILSLFNDL